RAGADAAVAVAGGDRVAAADPVGGRQVAVRGVRDPAADAAGARLDQAVGHRRREDGAVGGGRGDAVVRRVAVPDREGGQAVVRRRGALRGQPERLPPALPPGGDGGGEEGRKAADGVEVAGRPVMLHDEEVPIPPTIRTKLEGWMDDIDLGARRTAKVLLVGKLLFTAASFGLIFGFVRRFDMTSGPGYASLCGVGFFVALIWLWPHQKDSG